MICSAFVIERGKKWRRLVPDDVVLFLWPGIRKHLFFAKRVKSFDGTLAQSST